MGFFGFGVEKATSPHLETFKDLPEDQEDWGCFSWMKYHKANAEIDGLETANELVILEWERLSVFSSIFGCQFNCSFQDYFEKAGVDVKGVISGLTCTTEEIVANVEKSSTNITALLKTVTSPFFLIPVLGAIGFFGFTKRGKAILKKGL